MRIGIDLGGTKTEIICLNEDNGKEIYRQRVPSPINDYKATIKNMADMVTLAEQTTKQSGSVGLGIPGTVSKITGKVKNANSTWLNGQPLDKDLENALKRPVKVENDANCFALSEAVDGAGQSYNTVFGVIIGTGCGAGVVTNKKTLTGINGISGEWGHNPLPFQRHFKETKNNQLSEFFDFNQSFEDIFNPIYKENGIPEYYTDNERYEEFPGPQCYCGKRGCLETWISGTGFKKDYHRVENEEISTHDIISNMKNGDEKAIAAYNRYADRLARGLAGVINTLDPDAIILGGGMGNIKELYSDVPKLWRKYILSDTVETKLLEPKFGDSSGVRGAAWLWND